VKISPSRSKTVVKVPNSVTTGLKKVDQAVKASEKKQFSLPYQLRTPDLLDVFRSIGEPYVVNQHTSDSQWLFIRSESLMVMCEKQMATGFGKEAPVSGWESGNRSVEAVFVSRTLRVVDSYPFTPTRHPVDPLAKVAMRYGRKTFEYWSNAAGDKVFIPELLADYLIGHSILVRAFRASGLQDVNRACLLGKGRLCTIIYNSEAWKRLGDIPPKIDMFVKDDNGEVKRKMLPRQAGRKV
jgi:hypothetical protein